jgi:sugar phosphate permease
MPSSSTTLFRDPRTWGVILARFFCDSIWIFYIFWLPDYLSRVRHLSLSRIGVTAWIPFLVAGLGNLVGGILSGMLVREGMPASFVVFAYSCWAANVLTVPSDVFDQSEVATTVSYSGAVRLLQD